MKMKAQDFQEIRVAMFSRLKDGKLLDFVGTPTIMEIIEKLRSDPICKSPVRRVMWDWFQLSYESRKICDNLYSYLTDSHIETALRLIINEAEPLTKDLLK
jgi:hypothetical protein